MSNVFIKASPWGYIVQDGLGMLSLRIDKGSSAKRFSDIDWKTDWILSLSDGESYNPNGSDWQIRREADELIFEVVRYFEAYWGMAPKQSISRNLLVQVYKSKKPKIHQKMMQAETLVFY